MVTTAICLPTLNLDNQMDFAIQMKGLTSVNDFHYYDII